MSNDQIFWLIWREHGNAPTKRHHNLFGAEVEAERLARANPGARYFVTKVDGAVSFPPPIPEPVPVWIRLTDDLPF